MNMQKYYFLGGRRLVRTTLGLKGGWISRLARRSQSMRLKNACSLMSRSPSGPQPSRLDGCLVISWERDIRRERGREGERRERDRDGDRERDRESLLMFFRKWRNKHCDCVARKPKSYWLIVHGLNQRRTCWLAVVVFLWLMDSSDNSVREGRERVCVCVCVCVCMCVCHAGCYYIRDAVKF